MSFCFVHAADLHLDTPFEGLGSLSPELQQALRDASLDAFDALIETTIEHAAAFLLLAGDIYDGSARDVRAQLRLRNGLQRLSDRGIPTFIIHGNHDPVDEGWQAITQWPEHVHIFSDQEVESTPVVIDGTCVATVHGMSYPTKHVTENLALRYKRSPESGIHIGLLHANAGSSDEHANYSPCSIEDLQRAGMDYWALGHIHKRQVLRRSDPWIVYPGNLQGRSPKPSEQGAKGALLVTVDGQTISEPEFLPLDRARFVELTLAIDDLPDVASLEGRLSSAARSHQAENPDRGLLLRATITGRGALHSDLGQPERVAGLLSELRAWSEAEQPFLWWDRLQVRTQPDLDRDVIRRRGDFTSDLLALIDNLRADPDALSVFAAEQLPELQRAPISQICRIDDGVIGDIESDLAQLLADAETIVLSQLESRA
ncbi:MAG: metallophosphoesterase family protein [Thermomicrobiales bacterium]